MDSYLVSQQTGQRFPEQTRTTGQTIGAGLLALVDATAGVTVLAPATPDDGTVFAVSRSAGAADIVVDGNGRTIDGSATVSLDSTITDAVFVADGGVWRRIEPLRSFGASFVFPLYRTADSGGGGGGAPGSSGQFIWNNGGVLDGTSGITTDGTDVAFGTNPAAAGYVRFPYLTATLLALRNNSNTADWNLLSFTSASSTVTLGDLNLVATLPWYSCEIYTSSATGIDLHVAGLYGLKVTSTAIKAAQPIGGDEAATMPLRLRKADVNLGGAANYTLSAAEAAAFTLVCSNANAGGTTVTAPDQADARYEVVVSAAGGPVSITKGGVSTFTVAAGKTAQCRHNGTQYVRATADV